MIILNNGILKVEIAETGAEIRRVTVCGEDAFYDGNPEIWSGVAPVLFPICGGLKNDTYTLNGKSYTIPKHGFARKSLFEVEDAWATGAVFLLRDNADTLKAFPWSFELRIKYTLSGSCINVEYDVFNKSDSKMYMSIGSHEAYSCPEGIEDYDIIFEKKETLKAFKVVGTSLSREYDIMLNCGDTLPLYNKYFDIDALVFSDIKSRFVTLKNRKTGRSISVSFDGCNYLLLWTKPEAPYICIEPWAGIPSFLDEGSEISQKEGINAVEPNGHFTLSHKIYL